MNQFRLGLAMAGMIFAVAGVLRDDRRLMWIAMAALGVSVLLRVYLRRHNGRAS